MNGELVFKIAERAIVLGPATIELVKAIVDLIDAPKPAAAEGGPTVDDVRAQIAEAQSIAQRIADTARAELEK